MGVGNFPVTMRPIVIGCMGTPKFAQQAFWETGDSPAAGFVHAAMLPKLVVPQKALCAVKVKGVNPMSQVFVLVVSYNVSV